jgi:hypothetical protein
MKRKTNLFYFKGDESNFLTFSNYTEHLTGNFLATDYKLFPSRFVCLNIPLLNDEKNKEIFIKNYLAGYYENKLAFLRDKLLETEKNVDENILYLQFLFDTIYKYLKDNENQIDNQTIDDVFNKIFIGNITEQNYNGTFTDIICTIEYNNSNYYMLPKILTDSKVRVEYDINSELQFLYNWNEKIINNGEIINNYIGPSNYKDVNPLCDEYELTDDNKNVYYYVYNSLFDNTLIYNDIPFNSIEFNIIIPLYDIVNVNYKTNQTIIDEKSNINLVNNDIDCACNVPLGIWFANKTISLERDIKTGYTPSWSLLIGTQFKPFPNSNMLTTDITNNAEQIIKPYSTFAEILHKQNDVINLISKYNVIINDLNNKIKKLENSLSKIADLEEINSLKNEMKELINKFNSTDDKIVSAWIYKTNNENKK